jgi:thiamine biosynthesis lipoprotein
MGCEVVVEGASPATGARIRALFETWDATFSRFRSDSELSRLNAAGGGAMSPLFAELLDVALWAATKTDGLVDPTLGAAVVSAGYDRDFEAGLDSPLPAGAAAPSGLARLCRTGPVLVLPGGLQLDLNGVVKSCAVDRAAALLDADGFVSAGGDLMTRGPVDVALQGGEAVRVVGGLATSGTARRRWLRAGEPQHHLIDPASGRPASSPWVEASVCASTCVGADVAAKAALLAGPAWLERRRLPGRLIARDGSVHTTGAWRRAMEPACI